MPRPRGRGGGEGEFALFGRDRGFSSVHECYYKTPVPTLVQRPVTGGQSLATSFLGPDDAKRRGAPAANPRASPAVRVSGSGPPAATAQPPGAGG